MARLAALQAAAGLVALLALPTGVSACHQDLHRWAKRQDRTTEQGEAAITNPNTECQPYGYAPVTALQRAGDFPPIWELANLSTATTEAKSLFATLNSSIPNIAQKGTGSRTGNFSGVSYNGQQDPDCWWTWKQCTTPKISGLQADITRCAEPNTWGFTLDDGPNCSHNAYFNYLNSINQKATLFYIGSNVLDWPLEAMRGLDEGHEVCAHTWSHPYMTTLNNEGVFAELYYAKKAIKDVLGITVQCWRPPYGDVDDRVRYIAQALGMSTVVWADNTFDYTIATTNLTYVQNNYKAILAKQAAGAYNTIGTIVLSHELNNQTMSISESFLPQIQQQFAHVAPIAVCNNNSNPYIETGYQYPNFQQWAAGTRTISVSTATAASTDLSISIPLQTGMSGSLFATIAYATGAATAGAGSAGTTIGGNDNNGASAVVTGPPTVASTTSASTTSTTSHSRAARLDISLAAVGGIAAVVAGMMMGLVLV